MITICRTVGTLRAVTSTARSAYRSTVLVPTMGALHDGHLSLMRYAATLADEVIATIFVNPTQFGQGEDLDTYPRQEAEDIAALESIGVKAVFVPGVAEMYSANDATRIVMEGPALGLEADFRPHFFGGVATVVSRLLLAGLTDKAVFGEKDYQQLLVIKRMVADLKIPVSIHGAPTVREEDGLAMSSRNVYLSQEERRMAPKLHMTLQACAADMRSGIPSDAATEKAMAKLQEAGFKPDYVEARDAQTLGALVDLDKGRLLTAAWLGKTRLIDNIPV